MPEPPKKHAEHSHSPVVQFVNLTRESESARRDAVEPPDRTRGGSPLELWASFLYRSPTGDHAVSILWLLGTVHVPGFRYIREVVPVD